ncbi:MAG: helix-turn-helix transcriptional regulator [Candidatus Endonucleobacter bathymodioli]|uniref:Helix-turn-helix transcriptional regulator n=1 Tax=Candidatus Endonucleibacter bathymodioli TaxID=539814 RepID=A0AA90SWK2_9GAMM|nr:helix-turn-helix transcriptional regulator [Candidatus Endonucleobacter bathymodioli]
MRLDNHHSDEAILKEMGNRITQLRLNMNKSQLLLAQEAGISHRTLIRIEHGQSVQASSLIRILRTLQLIGNLDCLIPETIVSPVQQLKMQGKQRKRASSRAIKPKKENVWSWGDEK